MIKSSYNELAVCTKSLVWYTNTITHSHIDKGISVAKLIARQLLLLNVRLVRFIRVRS